MVGKDVDISHDAVKIASKFSLCFYLYSHFHFLFLIDVEDMNRIELLAKISQLEQVKHKPIRAHLAQMKIFSLYNPSTSSRDNLCCTFMLC